MTTLLGMWFGPVWGDFHISRIPVIRLNSLCGTHLGAKNLATHN